MPRQTLVPTQPSITQKPDHALGIALGSLITCTATPGEELRSALWLSNKWPVYDGKFSSVFRLSYEDQTPNPSLLAQGRGAQRKVQKKL